MANVSPFHRTWLVSMSLFWLVEATCAVAAATLQTAGSFTSPPVPTTILPGPILAITLPATAVTQTSATLNGSVKPGSPFLQTNVQFKYSSNAVDWISVFAHQSPLPFGGATAAVSASVASLRCSTVYSFYVHAYGSGDPRNGDTLKFVTLPCAATTITLNSSSNAVNDRVFTLTAVVRGGDTPTGIVSFLEGERLLGTSVLDGAGRASFSTSTLAIGRHTFTASYSGDLTHAPVMSEALIVDANGLQQIPANSHVALVLLATMVCLIGAAHLWRVPIRSRRQG